MSNYTVPMRANHYYHVFNRTNNRDYLFINEEDKAFFLKKYKIYLAPYIDTFAYSLLDNHFHLSIRVKDLEDIEAVVEKISYKKQTVAQKTFLALPKDLRAVEKIVEAQFTRWFTSYAMYFNIKHSRSGNLFHRPFKRIEVVSESHFTWLIFYINANIRRHRIKIDFQDYTWCSYPSMLSSQTTSLCRTEVLEWFGGLKNFIDYHQQSYFETEETYYLIVEE